jgi:hypothetical protein
VSKGTASDLTRPTAFASLLPGNFERYLRGIEFPIGKQELLHKLEQNGAPGVVVSQVGKRLP